MEISDGARYCENCGRKIRAKKNKGSATVKSKTQKIILISFVVVLFALICIFSCEKISDGVSWSNVELNNVLPEPKSNKADIILNSEDGLSLKLYEISERDYEKYLSKCEKFGFTVESERERSTYDAYNNEGYKLKLEYRADVAELCISLNVPMKLKRIHWPLSGLAELLPKPESDVGIIESDNDEEFCAYIKGKTVDEYYNYVELCADSGFENERNNKDGHFEAKNNERYALAVEYKGDGLFYISLERPETAEGTTVSTSENTEPTTEVKEQPETVTDKAEAVTERTPENTTVKEPERTTEKATEETTENKTGSTVYVTPYGKKYHYSKSCAGKNAMGRNINDVKGSYDPCKKCVG